MRPNFQSHALRRGFPTPYSLSPTPSECIVSTGGAPLEIVKEYIKAKH
jgi:hypothetical protein